MNRFKHFFSRLAKLRSRPPAEALFQMKGYNVCINGWAWKYFPTWKEAYKQMRKLQRQFKGTGHGAEMRRLKPGDKPASA